MKWMNRKELKLLLQKKNLTGRGQKEDEDQPRGNCYRRPEDVALLRKLILHLNLDMAVHINGKG